MPFLGSWCTQCGPHVSVDEDGCCNACGCSAVGQGADEAHATIADLRDRLAPWTCPSCDVAPLGVGDDGTLWPLCADCFVALWHSEGCEAACISVGLRTLCGRRILEGVE